MAVWIPRGECSPLALTFFGGELRMVAAADSQSKTAQVLIDDWIIFDAGTRLAKLLVELRAALERVLAQKMCVPSMQLSQNPVIQAVSNALAHG